MRLQAWKRVTARMITYMRIVRHHRLARHRLIIIHERRLDLAKAWYDLLKSRPIAYLVPRSPDLALFPSIRRLLQAPTDTVVTRTILDNAVFDIGQDVIRWRSDNAMRMLSAVDPDMPTASPGMGVHDRLQLATCVLTCISPSSNHLRPVCRSTKEFMWHPQFFDHCCNHISETSTKERLIDSGMGIGDFCSNTYSLVRTANDNVWNTGQMAFNKRASAVVQNILIACGVDHQKASVEFVDALGLYVLCWTCYVSAPNTGRMTVMTWRRAVSLTISYLVEIYVPI